jgi:ferrochelatase
MSYAAEPKYRHGSAERTAILLTNLGTPEAPTAAALRRYLRQFLWDRRVVEIPRAVWWLILHGIILRLRPSKSAAKYASVWTDAGSPLLHWTERQATLLRGYLGQAGHDVLIRPAMRYGNPAIADQLDALKAEGATRVLVLPLYPQYAAATTASTIDAVAVWAMQVRRVPELRFVNQYHDHPDYIAALAASIRDHWTSEGRGRMLVMSFHGIPARSLQLGDPYHCHCHKTARLLAAQLGLTPDQYRVTFQSRFGRARWLEPYTEPTLCQLAADGVAGVDVVCPGFPADCLETLEEISQEARHAFIEAGGKVFHYIPCLNERPDWIRALMQIALGHLQGWPTAGPVDETAATRQRELAMALGAED